MNKHSANWWTLGDTITSIRDAIGSHARIVHVPGWTLPILSRILGVVLRDVLLTTDEFQAMAAGLADAEGPATGSTAVSGWLAEQGSQLGQRYANELNLHFSEASRLHI